MNERLDVELVKREMFPTRSKAQSAIKSGIIYCDNKKVKKNNFMVNENTIIDIKGKVMPYVSRGGLKLEKAIKYFNIKLDGKVMCDIDSSTGGFSDCAIQNNISKIYAIDVGSEQFDPKLRNNEKITLYENTDFRNIDSNILEDVNIVTIDVSFISVTKLIEKIGLLKNVNEVMCLVKPQFECGMEIANKYKGIIKNKEVHIDVINNLISSFEKINFNIKNLTSSPIKGGDGNIEYLLYLTKDKKSYIDVKYIVDSTFK